MFYSEQLLNKTGPLARVWMASNIDRKLTKAQILGQDITTSTHLITGQGQAPMALRFSSQLMLGVVKIYGRKARYLLDDCNEQLLKIRMTFKSTNNHDLPHQSTTTIELNLPEQLTIDDLFPALDFGFSMTQQPTSQIEDRAVDYEEDWTESLDPQTTQADDTAADLGGPLVQHQDLGLDLGEDVGMDDTTISIQVGRGEATPRPDDPTDIPQYQDLGLDLGEDEPMPDLTTRLGEEIVPGIEDDELTLGLDQETAQLREATVVREDSPLSEADPEFMAEADRTFNQEDQDELEADQVVAQQRQTTRRFKPMLPDRETVLHNTEIKNWSADRSKILKPLSLLPHDPELLALIQMQQSGAFVTNAMNDLNSGWAPEIAGLMSFEAVYRSGHKRKRDSGIADVVSEDGHSDKSPRLDRPSEQLEEDVIEDEGVEVREESPLRPLSEARETSRLFPEPTEEQLQDEAIQAEDDGGVYIGDGGFDETTIPLVHPADSGPISLSTQHAVHLLREVFGTSPDADSPSTQSRKSVLLQEIIPETRTSREDATKMFFETLVLATKDAIKVDQPSTELGMPIRVRAKRGLWGQWAEPSQGVDAPAQEVEVGA